MARVLQRAAAMSEYHEPVEELDASVRDMHRAIISLMEELEAVDWYAQRVARCTDAELKRILAHNMNEEMEHGAMLIEWLRRRSPDWDRRLRQFLFTSIPLGHEAADADTHGQADGQGLGIGSLKERLKERSAP